MQKIKKKHWKLIKFNLNYLSISLIKIVSHNGNFKQAIQKENFRHNIKNRFNFGLFHI